MYSECVQLALTFDPIASDGLDLPSYSLADPRASSAPTAAGGQQNMRVPLWQRAYVCQYRHMAHTIGVVELARETSQVRSRCYVHMKTHIPGAFSTSSPELSSPSSFGATCTQQCGCGERKFVRGS